MQVGITGAGVAVIEGRGDQSGGVDLGHTVGSHARKRGVFFEKFQGFGHGVVVAFLDRPRDRCRRDRPQRGDGFDRGECQVIAGHRGGGRTRIAGDEPGQFPVIGGGSGVAFGEHLAPECGADGARMSAARLACSSLPTVEL